MFSENETSPSKGATTGDGVFLKRDHLTVFQLHRISSAGFVQVPVIIILVEILIVVPFAPFAAII